MLSIILDIWIISQFSAAIRESYESFFYAIQKWLAEHNLGIKDNWQIYLTSIRQPVALGYRFGHGYTLLKKRNLLRLKRQLNRYYYKKRHHRRISMRFASGLLSRLGQLNHCNSTQVMKRIYRGRVQKDLKTVVRRYSRREKLKWSTFSEEMTLQATKP